MDEHGDGARTRSPSHPDRRDDRGAAGPGERTHRFVRWALRHSLALWLGAIALAVPSTVALVQLYKNLTSEVEELLPRNAPSVTAVEELRQRLPGLSTLGVVVATSSPTELPAAERLIDDLAARVREYPAGLVRAVKTGEQAAAERRFLAAHLPLFVDLDDLVQIRERVEARRSWDTRKRLSIDFDEEDKPPPLDFSDIEAKYQARYPGVRLPTKAAPEATPERNRYTDEKSGTTLLLIEGTESSLGAHQANRLLSRVKHDIQALGGPAHYAPGLRVGFAGNIAVSVEELSALSADLGKSSVMVVLAVLLVIWMYFRWWAALPLLFIPLAIATVISFGLVTLPPFSVDRLNSSTGFLGSIVVGNGINFGVIWLSRYAAARRRGAPLEPALAEAVWGALPGTLVAAVAAATAYASLTITGFRGFRQFGMIGAVGMLACWGATYLLAPSLAALLERWNGHGPRQLQNGNRGRDGLTRVLHAVFAHPRAVVAVAVAITLVTVGQLAMLSSSHLESDFSKLRRRDTWTSGEGYWGRFMDRIIGGNLSPTVILTDSKEEASAVAARLRSEMTHPPLAGLVANVRSLDDAVPPDQPAKIAEVMKLRKQLTPVVRASLPPERVAEIDRLLGTDGLQPITLADLPPSLIAGLRESDGTLGRVVLVFPRLTKRLWQTSQLEGFIGKLRDIAAHAVPPGARPGRVAGTLPVSADITASLQRDAPRASLAALTSVAVVVGIIFRGSATGLVVIASLLLGIVWMVGATFLFGIKVNYANFAAFPITFGIGVDYAVNIMARFRQERAIRPPDALPSDPTRLVERVVLSTGGAVALCSLTTVIGYSSLLLAKNQALFLFGAVAVLGEVSCLSAALLALPATLLVWRRLTDRL
jgi:predicted RND superfamily exporter protein